MKSSSFTMCLAACAALIAIASPATAAPLEVGALTHSSVATANSETIAPTDPLLFDHPISPAATPGVVATRADAAATVNADAINGQAVTISAINNKLDAADPGARDRGLLLVT